MGWREGSRAAQFLERRLSGLRAFGVSAAGRFYPMAPLFAVSILALFLAVACSVDRSLEGLPEASALGAAPTTITVEGIEIAFSADVSRDFMPARGGKSGIMATASLRTVANESQVTYLPVLPAGVAIERLYVVRHDRVWVAKVREEPRGSVVAADVRVSAVDGPKWGPDETVDIIALVRVPRGAPVYVAVRGQRIIRLD
jgi:hypothetical protein